MKVAVITDANSGYTKKTAEEAGVFFLDMPIIIDGKNYFQDINLTREEFFESLTGGRAVSTSQPAPGDVTDFWDSVLDKGYDEIVYIPMSSGLSEACNTAKLLAEDYDGRVEVVDNHRISGTLNQSVVDAKNMASNGLNAKEIRERLEASAYDQSIYIAVDTLEFLKRGGRVTAAGAALGTALGIKPILTIQGGKLDAFAKVRGIHKCQSKILEAMRKDLEERFGGVPKEDMFLFAAGTLLTDEEIESWKRSIKEAFPEYDVEYYPLSLSISVHIGPGSLALGVAERIK